MTGPSPFPGGASVPLSVLDVASVGPGRTPAQAVLDVVEVAKTADEHGYRRFWVAEHHASRRTAGSAPVVFIAHIAAVTRRIRVGSGGVMLPNHAPLVVAEQFAVLEALHPGRIDLGLGRSSGAKNGNGLLDAALRRDAKGMSDFPELVDELLGFQRPSWQPEHAFRALELSPRVDSVPEVHILGASENGARLAAERSLPFVYGHHLGRSKVRPAALDRYRSGFVPGPYGDRPHVIVSVGVVCAATDEQAERLALDVAARPIRDNAPGPLTEVRERYLARQALDEAGVIHGAPATVLAGIDRLAAALGADEIMLVPYEESGVARSRTLRLTARAAAVLPV
jgi:luciferase family oxidoreductase group 1